MRILVSQTSYATQCSCESICTVEEKVTSSTSAKNSVQLSGSCNLNKASVLDWRRKCSVDQPVCGFSDHGRADSWRDVFLCMFPCLLDA
jgi:hypothetical protein